MAAIRILGTTTRSRDVEEAFLPEHYMNDYQTICANMGLLYETGIPQKLLVTSPRSKDGKTTFAINLSVTLAKMGRKVLLIDGDLRKADVAYLLKLCGAANGLKHVLMGESPADYICHTSVDNFDLLPSNPCEASVIYNLMTPDRLRDSLDELGSQYNHIVVDTPPTLDVPDALMWSRAVDGVVLTAYSGQTRSTDVRETLFRFEQMRVPVLGVDSTMCRQGRVIVRAAITPNPRPPPRRTWTAPPGPICCRWAMSTIQPAPRRMRWSMQLIVMHERLAEHGSRHRFLPMILATDILAPLVYEAHGRLYGSLVSKKMIAVPSDWQVRKPRGGLAVARYRSGRLRRLPLERLHHGNRWCIISNGRFVTDFAGEQIERILANRDGAVAIQVIPSLRAYRENICLGSGGCLAGFKRIYAHSVSPGFLGSAWPHHVCVRFSALDRLLIDGELPLNFDDFLNICSMLARPDVSQCWRQCSIWKAKPAF